MNISLDNNDGIILLDKKEGISTTQADYGLKKLFSTKKVGHAGTLDPFATGLIICGINRGTKVLSYLEGEDKTYIAKLQLGKATATLDKTGQIIKEQEVKEHSVEEIEKVLSSFLGESQQIPPMYSAIKIGGVPLYKKAVKNEEIERKPRNIFIFDIKLLAYNKADSTIDFQVHVSKGTYIRTLGSDIAEKLGEIGHLSELRRTQIGSFDISQAKKIEDLAKQDLIPISKCLPNIAKINVDGILATKVKNGNTIFLKTDKEKVMIIYQGQAIAIYKKEHDDVFRPEKEF